MNDPTPPTPLDLGEFVPGIAEQFRFARFSRDVNPLHMDEIAARRLLAGRPVAHGMHLVLVALERLAARGHALPRQLACEFVAPVGVGDRANLSLARDDRGVSCITVRVGGQVCSMIDLEATVPPTPEVPSGLPDLSKLDAPLTRSPAEWVDGSGEIRLDDLAEPGGAAAFPAVAAAIGRAATRALGALSYLVGMVCPGQHSVFSSFRIGLTAPSTGAPDALRFRVTRFDPRMQMVRIAVDGPLRGELRAFVRPAPQAQPSAIELQHLLRAGEFEGTRSIVIGGSRGLGEIAAKLIAAGGGDVTLTYALGAADADRVAEDIGATPGAGRCEVRRFVSGNDAPHHLAPTAKPDAILYFATPRIFGRSAAAYDPDLRRRFDAIYVEAFADLCLWADSLQAPRPVRLLVPSSVAVAERPRGMTEYAMSKAAAEVLAHDLDRALRGIEIVAERLPRLETDQTATIVKVAAASNAEVMLPIVRRLLSRGAG
jgi:NAD(P)-dependent dehydrogenase (short-subunit alcohol dehydrogenase family)